MPEDVATSVIPLPPTYFPAVRTGARSMLKRNYGRWANRLVGLAVLGAAAVLGGGFLMTTNDFTWSAGFLR
jgi:hypothetical protein